MTWTIYKCFWENEKAYEEDKQPNEKPVGVSDTMEHALDIAERYDRYETEICELMGRNEYEENFGYVAFRVGENKE